MNGNIVIVFEFHLKFLTHFLSFSICWKIFIFHTFIAVHYLHLTQTHAMHIRVKCTMALALQRNSTFDPQICWRFTSVECRYIICFCVMASWIVLFKRRNVALSIIHCHNGWLKKCNCNRLDAGNKNQKKKTKQNENKTIQMNWVF